MFVRFITCSLIPLPALVVPQPEIAAWRARLGLANTSRVVALAPGYKLPKNFCW